ncbi:hypothetical protein [Jeotgalibacillus proteolyticus]|uniref:hypothetical protein n=1 Tax=Jeotgalibacillus proteolyticus TaxID=2082395 RepID=UPI003CEE4907
MFNWMPHKEQSVCEKKLTRVMKRLKIDYFNFNWDRNSCFIEFTYHDESYKLKHSIEKAKKRGVILKNGMDCLVDLTQSLEDLCGIIDRGTYNFETWIAGMKQPAAKPVLQERVHIKYKSFDQEQPEFIQNERLIPFASGSNASNFDSPGQGRQFKLIKKNSN